MIRVVDTQLPISEIEISYKPAVKPSELMSVRSSQEVFAAFKLTWDESKIEFVEQFKVMLLNRANRILGICTLSTGTVVSSFCDPKLAFAIAIKANATGIIICHNHPSGCLLPSSSDQEITKRMVEVGKYMDLRVLDHLIISSEGYYSFADEGVL